MLQFPLLFFCEHALLRVILAHGSVRLGIIRIGIKSRSGLDIAIDTGLDREVVLVLEFRQVAFLAEAPCQMMVMSDVNHVVGVDCSEGG